MTQAGWVSAQHAYGDNGSFALSITVTDANDLSSTQRTAVTVENVAPTIDPGTVFNSAAVSGNASADQPVTVRLNFSDPGFDHDVDDNSFDASEDFAASTINWGDGTMQTIDTDPAITVIEEPGGMNRLTTGSIGGTHSYANGGIFTITITVSDDDGGAATATTTAIVSGVGVNNRVLQIIGTPGKDDVKIKLGSDGGSDGGHDDRVIRVSAKLDKDGSGGGSDGGIDFRVPLSGVDSIVIILGAGDDKVDIDKRITLDALIMGDGGRDKLTGGGGDDKIHGGEGQDELKGRGGNDRLFGDAGDDKLWGGAGNNVLLGGTGNDDLKIGSDGGSDGGGDNVLVGGAGDDKLFGGHGLSLLIGGLGADRIYGGHHKGKDAPGDILVGGYTSHDEDVDTLVSILNDWRTGSDAGDAYDTIRRNWLTPGLWTVSDDGERDRLDGSKTARDLFFANLDGSLGDSDELKGDKDDLVIKI